MVIKHIAVADLKPAQYNPRKMSREDLGALKRNIQEFGLVDPIVVNSDMTIIGGHQRYKVCLELGHDQIPCVVLHIDKQRERALNLALNKIHGEWDEDLLKVLLADLDDADISLTGFTDDELEDMFKELKAPPKVDEWDLSEAQMPFWIVIRGPLDRFDKVRAAIKDVGDDQISVEASL